MESKFKARPFWRTAVRSTEASMLTTFENIILLFLKFNDFCWHLINIGPDMTESFKTLLSLQSRICKFQTFPDFFFMPVVFTTVTL